METGENSVVFISTFNTLTDAKASARITQDWHTEHLNEFFQVSSRIAAGEVRVEQTWDAPREAALALH
jgi:hypothetical protein